MPDAETPARRTSVRAGNGANRPVPFPRRHLPSYWHHRAIGLFAPDRDLLLACRLAAGAADQSRAAVLWSLASQAASPPAAPNSAPASKFAATSPAKRPPLRLARE